MRQLDISPAELAEARDAIKVVMAKHPTVCAIGFGISNFHPERPHDEQMQSLRESREHLRTDCVEQVATAIAFLRQRCTRSKTPRINSYALKHYAESWGARHGYSPYVSNGALITSAIYIGITVRPHESQDIKLLGQVDPNAGICVRDPYRNRGSWQEVGS